MHSYFSSRLWLVPSLITAASLLSSCKTTTTYQRQPLPRGSNHLETFGQLDSAKLAKTPNAPNWHDGLTVKTAEWIALTFNPDLRLARLEADATTALEDYSDLRQDPTIGIDLMRLFTSVPTPWVAVGSLTTSLPVSGRLNYQRGVAEAETEAALMRAIEAEWAVRNELRQEWVHWSALEQRNQAITAFDGTLADFVGRAKKWQEAGEIGGREIALLEIERQQLTIEQRTIQREKRQRAAAIRKLMGLSPSAEYTLLPLTDNPTFVVTDATTRLQHNPTLKRLRAEYEIAERQTALEIKKQKPNLLLGGELESDAGDTGLGIIAETTLPIFNGNRAAITGARGQRNVHAARYLATVEQQTNDLAELQIRRDDLAAELAMLDKLRPMIDAEIKAANAQLKLGELDGFIVVESLKKSFATQIARIDRATQLAIANVQLQHLHWPTETFSGDNQ